MQPGAWQEKLITVLGCIVTVQFDDFESVGDTFLSDGENIWRRKRMSRKREEEASGFSERCSGRKHSSPC